MADALQKTLFQNPYVGPRAFTRDERLYGRDRELRELRELLIAERIVLLYSPSGAGKTSLIQATLIPALQKRRFLVLPVVRVSQVLPQGVSPGSNRYVMSTLLTLEEVQADGQRLSLEALSRLSLAGYLEQYIPQGTEVVLIFDQFEEVLTSEPANVAAKHAFFAQLGEALENRQIWALFAIREDYLGLLDPYLRPIPNRLKDTYRLDLLDHVAAKQAIQRPARAANIEFTDEAAEQLADDLRRAMVQYTDGTSAEVLGNFIEPVQLQVVCLRLWEKLFGGRDANPVGPDTEPRVITSTDVGNIGDVDRALANYYEESIQAVAQASGVSKRRLREWCGTNLITEDGLRGQVRKQPERSNGLDNTAIDQLIDAHLVRVDQRRGITWFELAHDRLIAPIRASNAAWQEANLSTLQVQTLLWEKAGRQEGLLLSGSALAEAEQWAGASAGGITETEQVFLEACRAQRTKLQRERRHASQMRLLALFALIGFILALFQALDASQQRATALEQGIIADQQRATALEQGIVADQQRATAVVASQIANARRLTADAKSNLQVDPQRSLLLALQAITITRELSQPPSEVEEALHQAIAASHVRQIIPAHNMPTYAVAFSPDNTLLASVAQGQTAKIWDAQTGQLRFTLSGHTSTVSSISFSRDGKRLATASFDKTAIVWNVETGKALRVISGADAHTDWVYDAAFSPDGERLATASLDKTVKIWNLTTGTLEQTLSGHTNGIEAVEFSADGALLVSGGRDKQAIVWDTTSWRKKLVLCCNDNWVRDVAISPNGKFVATAGGYAASLWDLETGSEVPDFNGRHDGFVNGVAFSTSGEHLLSGSSDHTAKLWELKTRRLVHTFKGSADSIWNVAFSRDGERLATAGEDGLVRVWDIASKLQVLTTLHQASAYAVSFSPDGKLLVTAGDDWKAKVWDREQGAPVALLHVDYRQRTHTGVVRHAEFSPDGRRIITASWDKRAHVWDVSFNAENRTLVFTRTLTLTNTDALSMAHFDAKGERLITASYAGTTVIWDAVTGQKLASINHEARVYDAAFSPNGMTVATAGDDNVVKLWRDDGKSYEVSHTLTNHTDGVYGLSFSPDGSILATASGDKSIKIWVVDSGAELRTLYGHTDSVAHVAFNRTGKLLASASYDNTVRLWDSSTGQLLQTFYGHTAPVEGVAFSPDGRQIASVGRDGTVRLWDILSAEVLTLDKPVIGLRFSRDGTELEIDSEQTVEIYDALTGTPKATVAPQMAVVPPDLATSDPLRTTLLTARDVRASLWNASDGKLIYNLKGHSVSIILGKFSDDGGLVATAGRDGQVIISDVTSGEERCTLNTGASKLNNLSFSSDKHFIATANQSGTVNVWEIEPCSKTPFRSLLVSEGWSRALSFHPQGGQLATGGDEHTVMVWDIATSRLLLTLQGHSGQITAITYSSDGRYIASASRDNTVRVWDAATGSLRFTLTGHIDEVRHISFNADNTLLASASTDGTVRVYTLNKQRLIEIAESHVIRSLTKNECAQFQIEHCP